jgi:hypothetical protein
MRPLIIAIAALLLSGCMSTWAAVNCGANGTVDMDPTPRHPYGEPHCG